MRNQYKNKMNELRIILSAGILAVAALAAYGYHATWMIELSGISNPDEKGSVIGFFIFVNAIFGPFIYAGIGYVLYIMFCYYREAYRIKKASRTKVQPTDVNLELRKKYPFVSDEINKYTIYMPETIKNFASLNKIRMNEFVRKCRG
ncbi:hypothetical protein [Yersinia phage MHG19]|nr:hypothetical protein [Yersinia phage MHG19]